ncbi:MAG: hypothetical protein RL726_1416, partial [Actinomycetota bacterium]
MASRPSCPDDVRRDRGQAAVEFVLTLPLVVILVLAVVQVAVVLTERSRLESITWTAARSASVAASPTTAAQDVVTELVGDDANVRVDNDGRFVTVRVRRTIATDVPVV